MSRSLRPKTTQSCGDLIQSPAASWYRHERFAAPPALSGWIEHFWLEEWRLESNRAETRELLPHPCVQLALSPAGARIYGVQRGRFVRTYHGAGRVFGAKFRAGAFFPFLQRPVSSISDSSIAAARVFPTISAVTPPLFSGSNPQHMVRTLAKFLEVQLPPVDLQVQFVGRVVGAVSGDREITRVRHLVTRFSTTERSLQRLFDRYVGAPPRWVIKRYRAYEALDHLNDPAPPPLATVAQVLGYFDQAHFANDFKSATGHAPAEFAAYVSRLNGCAPTDP